MTKHGFAAALICLGLPAMAQDFTYDPAILSGCLATEKDQPEICIGRGSTDCIAGEGGTSTVGVVACLNAERDQWAQLMDTSYDALMTEAESADAEMEQLGSAADRQVPHLEAMQKNWAAYRDEACIWEASRWGGGSGAGPAAAGCDMRLTGQQAAMLKVIGDGASD